MDFGLRRNGEYVTDTLLLDAGISYVKNYLNRSRSLSLNMRLMLAFSKGT